ncbi:MAG: KH domain-containing protein [Chloroflexi bacterium]|nr:KH domain-containing protein [Chloroflexota bacterium]
MKELVEHIVRSLVDHPGDVKVEVINQGGQTVIELHVAEEDMGRVIGKDGKVANAIRTLLRVVAAREGQRIQLEIV